LAGKLSVLKGILENHKDYLLTEGSKGKYLPMIIK